MKNKKYHKKDKIISDKRDELKNIQLNSYFKSKVLDRKCNVWLMMNHNYTKYIKFIVINQNKKEFINKTEEYFFKKFRDIMQPTRVIWKKSNNIGNTRMNVKMNNSITEDQLWNDVTDCMVSNVGVSQKQHIMKYKYDTCMACFQTEIICFTITDWDKTKIKCCQCGMIVHVHCYGIRKSNDFNFDRWKCDNCKYKFNKKCVFCGYYKAPNEKNSILFKDKTYVNALKPLYTFTNDDKQIINDYSHIICGHMVACFYEFKVISVLQYEYIFEGFGTNENILKQNKYNNNKRCYICKKKHWVIKCYELNCNKWVHPICGIHRDSKCIMHDIFKPIIFCVDHSPFNPKQRQILTNNILKNRQEFAKNPEPKIKQEIQW